MLDLGRKLRHRPDLVLTNRRVTDLVPAGERLVFRSNRRGLHELFERPALDSGGDTAAPFNRLGMYPTDWSPDGRTILFHMLDPATKHDIWRLDVARVHRGAAAA